MSPASPGQDCLSELFSSVLCTDWTNTQLYLMYQQCFDLHFSFSTSLTAWTFPWVVLKPKLIFISVTMWGVQFYKLVRIKKDFSTIWLVHRCAQNIFFFQITKFSQISRYYRTIENESYKASIKIYVVQQMSDRVVGKLQPLLLWLCDDKI